MWPFNKKTKTPWPVDDEADKCPTCGDNWLLPSPFGMMCPVCGYTSKGTTEQQEYIRDRSENYMKEEVK